MKVAPEIDNSLGKETPATDSVWHAELSEQGEKSLQEAEAIKTETSRKDFSKLAQIKKKTEKEM